MGIEVEPQFLDIGQVSQVRETCAAERLDAELDDAKPLETFD